MSLHSHLLTETERYCAVAGISKARLATLVVNDGKFFDRIAKGGDFTIRTYERFLEFFEKHPAAAHGTHHTASPPAADPAIGDSPSAKPGAAA